MSEGCKESNKTGTIYVSFAGPQNAAGVPFETLNHFIFSGSIGSGTK